MAAWVEAVPGVARRAAQVLQPLAAAAVELAQLPRVTGELVAPAAEVQVVRAILARAGQARAVLVAQAQAAPAAVDPLRGLVQAVREAAARRVSALPAAVVRAARSEPAPAVTARPVRVLAE